MDFYSKKNSYLRHGHDRATFTINIVGQCFTWKTMCLQQMYKKVVFLDDKETTGRGLRCSFGAGVVGQLAVFSYALTKVVNSEITHKKKCWF